MHGHICQTQILFCKLILLPAWLSCSFPRWQHQLVLCFCSESWNPLYRAVLQRRLEGSLPTTAVRYSLEPIMKDGATASTGRIFHNYSGQVQLGTLCAGWCYRVYWKDLSQLQLPGAAWSPLCRTVLQLLLEGSLPTTAVRKCLSANDPRKPTTVSFE